MGSPEAPRDPSGERGVTTEPEVAYQPDEAIPVLARTPAVLRALLDGLPEAWTRATEGAGTWSAFEASRGKSLSELLDTFAELRAANVARLEALRLTSADLARPGRHPELGRVTLGQHLATWVAHDLSHLAQVARIMGRRYSQAAGPWRAYLPMLQQNG